MTIITCTRRLEFDAAHRVMRHESRCANLHGHRYRVDVTCQAPALDDVGRVVDFGVLKTVLGGWLDINWDHNTILNADDLLLMDHLWKDSEKRAGKRPWQMKGEPTAENMAGFLLTEFQRILDRREARLTVTRVRVYETPNCWSDAVRPDTVAPQPSP